MTPAMILAIIALACAVFDYFQPNRALLNVGVAALALAILV